MRLRNLSYCKFSYLMSSIPFRKYFSKLNPTKLLEIEVSICISSAILTLLVEQIPSVLSNSLFSFSSDFAVVLRSAVNVFHFYLHYSNN